jgi:hypothetical protein
MEEIDYKIIDITFNQIDSNIEFIKSNINKAEKELNIES